jgi:hypothetical protein
VLQQHSNTIDNNNANATTAGIADDASRSDSANDYSQSLLAVIQTNALALQSVQRVAHVTDVNIDRSSTDRIVKVLSIIQQSLTGGDSESSSKVLNAEKIVYMQQVGLNYICKVYNMLIVIQSSQGLQLDDQM